jgi:hypothetical protein
MPYESWALNSFTVRSEYRTFKYRNHLISVRFCMKQSSLADHLPIGPNFSAGLDHLIHKRKYLVCIKLSSLADHSYCDLNPFESHAKVPLIQMDNINFTFNTCVILIVIIFVCGSHSCSQLLEIQMCP